MTERVGRLACTSIDCEDPAELADFYAALLGLERVIESDGGDVIVVSDGRIALAMMKADEYAAPTWPDPAQPKQMHLDVQVDDVESAVVAAEALGARQAVNQDNPAVWRVMLDPAGHPFCLTTDVPDVLF